MRTRQRSVLSIVLAVLAAAPILSGQDWPQWRGPGRDGIVTGFREPATWPKALVKKWQVEVGLGYATPLLVGDRVYQFSRQGDDEVMLALEAGSGRTVWRTSYPAPFRMNPATSRHGAGPKSTPTLAGNRIFTLGMSGIVSAFDATTGKQIWQRPGGKVEPMYHTAMSPVVDGDLAIVHVGGHDAGALTAFDAATGSVKWSWNGDGPAYGSPMILDLAGTRQVVSFTQKHLVGVALASGALLWRRPFTTPATTTSQTPIQFRDMVIEAGRDNGITAFKVVRKSDGWATENVWHTDEVSLHMTNGVATDGLLFGLSHLNSGQYFGLDLESGRVLWKGSPRQAENAAIESAGRVIFSLQNDGQLLVVRPSRTAFDEIARYKVAATETWAQPAISGNRLFVKDVSSLTLWTLE